jgi:glyoxylase-like metal-dependent hydrolase (beta-lactamase superfamily II)
MSRAEDLRGPASRRPKGRSRVPSAVYRVLAVACFLVAAFCLWPSAYCLPPAPGQYEVLEIAPQVFVWVPEDILDQLGDPRFNRAGTVGFISTPQGVVVVNTTNSPFHAREVLYEIRRRTELPVRYVIDTGSAGDCMLGNEVFQDLRATIISTIKAREEIALYRRDLARRIREDFRLEARMRGIHVTVPGQTFDRDMSIRLGGREIKLLNFGGGQSPGDAVVYLPDTKVAFLGRLFYTGFFPAMNGSDVRHWIEILREVEGWDVTTYVPVRGLPGGKKELAEFRGFLEWLLAEVEPRVRQGMSLVDIKREVNPLEKYDWRARDLAPRAVEAVYKQLASQ